MKRLADSAPPTRPGDRYTITRAPVSPSEIERARREAVVIVRSGLQPYMAAHGLRMPPPSIKPTLSDLDWMIRRSRRDAAVTALAASVLRTAHQIFTELIRT